jgi:hypothetical protein
MQALVSAEMLMGPKDGRALLTNGPSPSSGPKGRRRRRQKVRNRLTRLERKRYPLRVVSRRDEQRKCFNCSLKGHWRTACPQPKKVEKVR